MKKYFSPEINFVEFFLEESIANPDCFIEEVHFTDGVSCQLYAAMDLQRPCCEHLDSPPTSK